MEKILKLTNKSEFLKFLDAISKINDQGVILDIKNNKVSALVSSLDSTLILHTELTGIDDLENTLNIPDVKKLKHVLDTIEYLKAVVLLMKLIRFTFIQKIIN